LNPGRRGGIMGTWSRNLPRRSLEPQSTTLSLNQHWNATGRQELSTIFRTWFLL
jgi:hypothetical protein